MDRGDRNYPRYADGLQSRPKATTRFSHLSHTESTFGKPNTCTSLKVTTPSSHGSKAQPCDPISMRSTNRLTARSLLPARIALLWPTRTSRTVAHCRRSVAFSSSHRHRLAVLTCGPSERWSLSLWWPGAVPCPILALVRHGE